jgi:hypothetical protein
MALKVHFSDLMHIIFMRKDDKEKIYNKYGAKIFSLRTKM